MTEQQQRELAAGLKALAATTRDAQPSAEVPQAVLAAAREHACLAEARPVFSARRRVSRWMPVAAALLLAVGGALWTASRSTPPAPVEPAGFVALPEAAALPLMESANIVRVSLPVAALPAYGVAVADFKSESVEAELLVAQDGRVRAIRLVSNSTNSDD